MLEATLSPPPWHLAIVGGSDSLKIAIIDRNIDDDGNDDDDEDGYDNHDNNAIVGGSDSLKITIITILMMTMITMLMILRMIFGEKAYNSVHGKCMEKHKKTKMSFEMFDRCDG